MKLLILALATSVSIACLAPVEAAAQGRTYRVAKVEKNYRFYGRPHSVQANGLCQRDTGTPSSQLDFRNKCDTEEYWNRVLNGNRRR